MNANEIKTKIEKGTSLRIVEAELIIAGKSSAEIKKLLAPYRSGKSTNDFHAIVKIVRQLKSEGKSRNVIAAELVAQNLTTLATAKHYLSLQNYVDEYVRQELAK